MGIVIGFIIQSFLWVGLMELPGNMLFLVGIKACRASHCVAVIQFGGP